MPDGARCITKIVGAIVLIACSFTRAAHAQSAFNINLDTVRRSVVFLHTVDQSGALQEAGTGFLIAVPTKSDPNKLYLILATARHIADPRWAGCPASAGTLRAVFNKKAFDPQKDRTGTVEVNLAPNWTYPEDESADVAVTILNVSLFTDMDTDNAPIPISDLPTTEEEGLVNSGAQIVSAGLLLGASGINRNYPIFKFGYVSSKPDEKINVFPCCVGCLIKSNTEWMIAASLVPGNSGSPIFFVPVGFPGFSISNQRAFLLGVQSISFVGSDVAGMAPARFVRDAIQRLSLPDADLRIIGIENPRAQPIPSSARPTNPAVPGILPMPK